MRTIEKTWLMLGVVATALSANAVDAKVYLSVEQAQSLMFPGETLVRVPVELTAEQLKAIQASSKIRVREKTLRAWRTVNGGWFLLDQVLGKHEFITYAVALDSKGAVKQVEILDYRESYGDQIRNDKWRAQFYGKKNGAALKLDQDIKNISGATLSCRHVADGVRRLLATYVIALQK